MLEPLTWYVFHESNLGQLVAFNSGTNSDCLFAINGDILHPIAWQLFHHVSSGLPLVECAQDTWKRDLGRTSCNCKRPFDMQTAVVNNTDKTPAWINKIAERSRLTSLRIFRTRVWSSTRGPKGRCLNSGLVTFRARDNKPTRGTTSAELS